VSALLITNTDHGTTERSTSGSLGDICWVQKSLYSCIEGMCHSSTCPPNVWVCHCMWSVLLGLPLC